MALRSMGWTSTPKQKCNFVAVWTADREDIALAYAGIIGDEDQSPEERAADRAERLANRLDRTRIKAVNQWEKAEYWQERTLGVISHALHKQSAHVRRGRILELEADLRKREKTRHEMRTGWEACRETLTALLNPVKKRIYHDTKSANNKAS